MSICILTHNRPLLFERCISAVQSLRNIDSNIDVVVNNDSDDVIPDSRARYFYHKGTLNEIYELLYRQARGSHIWFVEDDDVPLKLPVQLDVMTIHRYVAHDYRIMGADINSPEFQLSQCCIPKQMLDFNTIEHNCNCIFNDWHLTRKLPARAVPDILYRQTYNGDNISFPESPGYRGRPGCSNCSWLPAPMRRS